MPTIKHNHNHSKVDGRCRNRIFSHDRKGIVDVQFNWIFVMIAGCVIFLFIISIIFSQKSASEKQTSISAMNQITTIFKSKQSSDIYSETNIPETKLTFTCDADTLLFGYKMSGGVSEDLPTTILFAPPEITTNKILMWTQSFNTGFPVGVFTYLTTSDTIILIYSNQGSGDPLEDSPQAYARSINSEIPGNITHKMVDDSKIRSYYKYANKKVICIEGDCPENTPGSTVADNMDYMKIYPGQDGLYPYGTVEFYRKGSSLPQGDGKYPYLTEAGLFGAIFSYTPNYYYCQMSRAFGQFEIKRMLLQRRLDIMQEEIDNVNCKTTMQVLTNNAIKPMKLTSPTVWSEVTDGKYLYIESMYTDMNRLDAGNVDLELSSCPKMY